MDITCNIVFVFPREYDQVMEIEETEDAIDLEIARHMPVCYYVMKNGCMEEQNTFFERPGEGMKNHLKPLFIRGKVENVRVNKILVDGGEVMNLMSHYMLKRIGKDDTETKSNNMVLSNYEGKVGTTMGVIQVDLTVGTITRPTMFMVISSKSNYNMLLGREWIHGIGAFPSSLYQQNSIWRNDGIMENIEANQSYYMAEVNQVDRRHFDKHLAHICPCNPIGFNFTPTDNALCSLYLHLTHGFQ